MSKSKTPPSAQAPKKDSKPGLPPKAEPLKKPAAAVEASVPIKGKSSPASPKALVPAKSRRTPAPPATPAKGGAASGPRVAPAKAGRTDNPPATPAKGGRTSGPMVAPAKAGRTDAPPATPAKGGRTSGPMVAPAKAGRTVAPPATPAKGGRTSGPLVAPAKAGRTSAPARLPKLAGPLRGLSDIRRYFFRNQVPVFFISATNFNLMNLDEWVRRVRYINYIDCFDGRHPHVFVPSRRPHEKFESLEEIVNHLLEHPEVQAYVRARGGGKALFLFFDERTEELCRELGLEICFPSAALRSEIDHKINATRIGNRAKVRSVPNVLVDSLASYADLERVAKRLGGDLVLQTAFGDSGHTTFFIKNEADWNRHADEIVDHGSVKVMKRIEPLQAAVEACVTRAGTIVGPLMTEIVGFDELTPYRGGWAGNEVFAGAFSKRIRDAARRYTIALGKELEKMGYRGYFEVDYLIDRKTGNVYLGEINPRITGASSMTNLAAFAHADAPLVLFHLLEFLDVDFELDVDSINARWSDPENIDTWSQLVLKHTDDTVELINQAPASGVWRLEDDGSATFLHPQTHRRTVERENEAYFLRIARAGDYRYEGADLGILLTPSRLLDDHGALQERAKAWIRAIRAQYVAEPVPAEEPVREMAEIGAFKLL